MRNPSGGRASIAFLVATLLAVQVWAISLSPVAAAEPSPAASAGPFQAGINVLVYNRDIGTPDEFTWKIGTLLDRLVTDHVNSVNIVWLVYVDGVHGNRVFKGEETPPDEALDYIVRQSVMRGLYVILRPIIDETSIVADGRLEWRGTIRPTDVNAWFASYRSLLDDYARLGESDGADALNIGTELTSMEQYTPRWRDLIDGTRQVFHGQLGYSSNQGISDTIPWNKLDFVGVDAFFRLDTKVTSLPAMVDAWAKWETITGQAKALGKPLLLTEIGSASQYDAHRTSWVWDHKTPVDLEDQRLFYASACIAWKDRTQGIFWWATPIWILDDPLSDSTFTPLGKPAEAEIARCFAPDQTAAVVQ